MYTVLIDYNFGHLALAILEMRLIKNVQLETIFLCDSSIITKMNL